MKLLSTTAALSVLMLSLCTQCARAMPQIDVALNLVYTNPNNPATGGTWQLVAKSTDNGLASLSVKLTNISGTVTKKAPTGTINGNQAAGFDVFAVAPIPEQFTAIALAQGHLPSGGQAGVFYGVGTLLNGSPEFPAKPMGSNSIGPSLTALTAPMNIPWATGDVFAEAAWNTAAVLASGTFASGAFEPGLYQQGAGFAGSVFTTLGTATTRGLTSDPGVAMVSSIVRTNLISADYNRNGFIDAADYTVWRDTLGTSVSPGAGADGNRNGMIDQPDYDFWKMTFTGAPGAAVGAVSAVPEPGWGVWLAAIGGGAALRRARKTRGK